jgi:hypothetical protein
VEKIPTIYETTYKSTCYWTLSQLPLWWLLRRASSRLVDDVAHLVLQGFERMGIEEVATTASILRLLRELDSPVDGLMDAHATDANERGSLPSWRSTIRNRDVVMAIVAQNHTEQVREENREIDQGDWLIYSDVHPPPKIEQDGQAIVPHFEEIDACSASARLTTQIVEAALGDALSLHTLLGINTKLLLKHASIWDEEPYSQWELAFLHTCVATPHKASATRPERVNVHQPVHGPGGGPGGGPSDEPGDGRGKRRWRSQRQAPNQFQRRGGAGGSPGTPIVV